MKNNRKNRKLLAIRFKNSRGRFCNRIKVTKVTIKKRGVIIDATVRPRQPLEYIDVNIVLGGCDSPEPNPDRPAIELHDDQDTEKCDYIKGSNEPCKDCPRRITALHMCGILQEIK